jgi:hypothetical protein
VAPRTCDACGNELGEPGTSSYCHGLGYASRQAATRDQPLYRARRIRRWLGGSVNLLDPFPPKPPRMHWPTYERAFVRGVAAER